METRYKALIIAVVILASATLMLFSYLSAQPVTPESKTLQIIEKFPSLTFERPLDLQSPNDGTNRLFIVEQTGRIFVFANTPTVNESTLFLDLSEKITSPEVRGNEEGLLGLAFHPDYETNGYFFVDYTTDSPRMTVISRFTVDTENPNSANPDSEKIILEIAQPYQNHNGGQLRFGPDGYLYIAMGDGGSAGDPQGNAQNLTTLLGAILRIDVNASDPGLKYSIPASNPFTGNSEGYREEIYAYGLRNPWRFSFDALTETLWVGDVGQNAIEEIDIVQPGGNYGWNIKEGDSCYNPAVGCNSTGLTDPIFQYHHDVGQCITGGFVYRGSNLPVLSGHYVYADYISGRIWSLNHTGNGSVSNTEVFDTNLRISSFGVDSQNEIYFLAFNGKVYSFELVQTENATTTGVY
ncbi:MAG: glucose sorbosone dehydrogenase [Candidatus Thorarchaeota archaeon]|nr:glucose sorbosone dehydrogenase [Candidatus Thorarchaeota archaeon]